MELTVYRQSAKKRPDGTTVYKGEDALPYVDEDLFFVADGLGGAASIRHQHINPDLFEKNKLMDTLFKGVYDDYDDERLTAYVINSFFELFAVKDCYTQNINNIKKSGYFASRIVTAILLHTLIYNESVAPSRLFELYHAQESDELREEFLKKLGDYFAKVIQNDLRKVAKNANLYYESSYSGLALLGTTLCATIYNETEDGVETIYFTAGDSRPYVWTEKDGLCQLLEDQEGKDGGMTNYIKANEGESFGIRCNYMTFKKPCVLFNTSDGCFESGYFLSQMAFEKLILDKAVSSEDVSAMGNSLYETFLTYGRHDDSSTMAMKFFGYGSFSEFQDSASRRLNQLDEEYLSKLPGLLERDFNADYKESASKLPSMLSDLKEKLINDPGVRTFCAEQMISEGFPPYETRMQSVRERLAEEKQQSDRILQRIETVVARNFSRFYKYHPNKNSVILDKVTVSTIFGLESRYKQLTEKYSALINKYKYDLEKTTEQLNSAIGLVFDAGIPFDFSAYDGISMSTLDESRQCMSKLFEFLYSIKKAKQDTLQQLIAIYNEYIERNTKFAYKNIEGLHEICNELVSGRIDPSVIQNSVLKNDYDTLAHELTEIRTINARAESLEKEEKASALNECCDAYWEKNFMRIAETVVYDPQVAMSDELRNEARVLLDEVRTQTGGIRDKAELQKQLFEQYDVSYSRYLGGKRE